ncbi:MAG: hypothetical protein CVU51_12155, partial [Deltaproteobacteria bacterium HGW-Deltaproteobacteria-1]
MAVDLKFSGEFYAAGLYQDKTTLAKDMGPSTAFYFQRLRLNTVFVVAPGLTLTTRADIMERSWGASRAVPGTTLQGYTANVASAGTDAENQNIAFDLAYVTYISPIGIISAGYQIDGAWGTVFGDNSIPTGKVSYVYQAGPVTLIAQTGKNSAFNASGILGVGGEQSYPRGTVIGAIDNSDLSDADNTFYTLAARYAWNTGQAGFLYKYIRIATLRNPGLAAIAYEDTIQIHVGIPYVKAQFGPVAIQSEIMYAYGAHNYESAYLKTWDGIPGADGRKQISVLNGWVDVMADFDRFYIGGTFAYLSGQNPHVERQQQGVIDGGYDWNPMLILWNSDRNQWAGSLTGNNGSSANTAMANAYFYQVRGGVRPIDKIDIMASVAYAHAVVKPSDAWLYNSYGWEVDLTGTYKITNNLSYMLGMGYLFAGDYFKGTSDLNDVQ